MAWQSPLRRRTKATLLFSLLGGSELVGAEPITQVRRQPTTIDRSPATTPGHLREEKVEILPGRRIDSQVLQPPPETATTGYVPPVGGGLSYMQEREQLASAFRALAAAGLSAASGLGNHLTMSVPPDYTKFLLNRYGLHWMEVTAENLVLVDADGTILEGEGPVQGAAIALHGPVHAARKETARVIFHTHQPWFTALACIKAGGLRMFHPDACIYKERIGFDPVRKHTVPIHRPVSTLNATLTACTALCALLRCTPATGRWAPSLARCPRASASFASPS